MYEIFGAITAYIFEDGTYETATKRLQEVLTIVPVRMSVDEAAEALKALLLPGAA